MSQVIWVQLFPADEERSSAPPLLRSPSPRWVCARGAVRSLHAFPKTCTVLTFSGMACSQGRDLLIFRARHVWFKLSSASPGALLWRSDIKSEHSSRKLETILQKNYLCKSYMNHYSKHLLQWHIAYRRKNVGWLEMICFSFYCYMLNEASGDFAPLTSSCWCWVVLVSWAPRWRHNLQSLP